MHCKCSNVEVLNIFVKFTDEILRTVSKWHILVTSTIVYQVMATHGQVRRHVHLVFDAIDAIQPIFSNFPIRLQVSFIEAAHTHKLPISIGWNYFCCHFTADPAANRKALIAKKVENSRNNENEVDDDDSDDDDEDPFAGGEDSDDPDFLGDLSSEDGDEEDSGNDTADTSSETD